VAAAPLVSSAAPEPSATAALVHDLRNPLATVHAGASYLLQLEGLPDEVRQVAGDMLASADAARALLVDLLDASKHDTGRLRGRFAPVDLAVLARRVLRAVRLLANARGQSLDFEVRAKDSVVHGDALLIERSLRNLLDNALKYAPERLPVTITLLETPDAALELRVADQGPTLSAEAGERAFAPYQRLETGSGVEGHGIGLAFCRRAMALHGGRAWVEPRPGGGNVFVLHLPRQAPASLR
jgi:signal transduction histidine kinase